MKDENLTRRIQASQLRVRATSPFFAALMLFAEWIFTDKIPTFATNGKEIFVNPEFANPLNTSEFDAVLLHEVLHAALQHTFRRGYRDPVRWNYACDVVVNGMIVQHERFKLPAGHISRPDLERLSVEEVYAKLGKQVSVQEIWCDLLTPGSNRKFEKGKQISSVLQEGILSDESVRELRQFWKNALRQAQIGCSQKGDIPAGMSRELEALRPGQLDWRSHLRRFLVRTPTDFQGFDRRFIWQKNYMDALEGESVRVHVCIDTSGSISLDEMEQFFGEVQRILLSYPHLHCDLYFADTQLYGPWGITPDSKFQEPIGGGGTCFKPFFKHIENNDYFEPSVAVYLTDGYGSFPEPAPQITTIWVVTSGGVDREYFPFGEIVRLVE